MCRGENLKSMCLYDYTATIHKIKISSKKIDKLARQKTREGRATRVDRFYFLGREQEFDETYDSKIKHPQYLTHMQDH